MKKQKICSKLNLLLSKFYTVSFLFLFFISLLLSLFIYFFFLSNNLEKYEEKNRDFLNEVSITWYFLLIILFWYDLNLSLTFKVIIISSKCRSINWNLRRTKMYFNKTLWKRFIFTFTWPKWRLVFFIFLFTINWTTNFFF